jgi:hypothetical protein
MQLPAAVGTASAEAKNGLPGPLPAIESQTVALRADSLGTTQEGSPVPSKAETQVPKVDPFPAEKPPASQEGKTRNPISPAALPQREFDTIVLKSLPVEPVSETEAGNPVSTEDRKHAESIQQTAAPASNRRDQPQEAELWLRTLESILPAPKGIPEVKTNSPGSARKPSPIETRKPDAVDAAVVIKACRTRRDEQNLPAPARPLNGPLILGAFALVTALLLPLTAALESSRVFGVIGFCMSGFFLPFAPIAWITGLSVEKRRREQRLRPERRVVIGRLLGQWGTLLLVAEGTIGLIVVAALRLSGRFPTTFWAE